MLPLNQMASNVAAFARANAFRYGTIAGPAFLGGIIGAANAEPGNRIGGFISGTLAGTGVGWLARGGISRLIDSGALESVAAKAGRVGRTFRIVGRRRIVT